VKRVFNKIIMSANSEQVIYQDHIDLTQKYIDIVSMAERAKHPDQDKELISGKSKKPEFIKIGQTIGQRALVDPQIVKKYISDNKARFCHRLGIDQKEVEEQLTAGILLRQQTGVREKQLRVDAIKQQYKFCKKCFENSAPKCDCLLSTLPPE
jgi:homoaconitase/3-isopropylmalate dehydratase large subunit